MNRICARAPVRVDPAGGGTDVPPFSVEHGGMVVNFAIQRHTYAMVQRLPTGGGVTIYSEDLGEGICAESVSNLPEGRLELLQGFVRRLVPEDQCLCLVTGSDVPHSAGLGGSGALGVAVVAALCRATGNDRSPEDIARLADDVERKDLGFPGGDQDSFAAALGGFNKLEYRKGGGTVPHRIAVSDETRIRIESNSLLVYTSEAHVSGDIHQGIMDSYADPKSPTLDAMRDLKNAAVHMAAGLEEGDLDAYVECMNRSCDSLYLLHPSCDSDSHRMYCRELGSLILGRKTCGAGGGGFLLVHTRPGRRKECMARAEDLGALVWPVLIDLDGVRTWEEPPTSQDDVDRYRKRAGMSA
jgi:D-glycero-alpha-D-manno-heptose-7-phosphate kinase